MRVLALDPGSVRIGVALSDELKLLASPQEYIPAEPLAGFLNRFKDLVREKEVDLVIVGMPRNMDGTYGDAAAKVREFVRVLKEAAAVPIRTWDERLTSVQANRVLRQNKTRRDERRKKIDGVAAAVLLQSYLDMQGFVG